MLCAKWRKSLPGVWTDFSQNENIKTAFKPILTKFLRLLNIKIYLYTFEIFQLNHIVSLWDVYIIWTYSILQFL